ncbi:hypothetical protein E2I00_009290, partial [Balaenoptera physalus]
PLQAGMMQSLRFISAEALASHPQVARQSLGGVAHNLYPLLFKASYLLEQAEVIRVLLEHWPLEEFRLEGPAPLRVRCLSFRADSLGPGQLLHVLRLAGPGELRRLEVVHNVRLHAGHVQQLLAQVGFPRLVSLTLPAKAFDAPPTSTPAPDGEDPLLTSIARELSRMTHLTELSVAFSTLTGKLQKLLGPLRTPLKVLDLGNCDLNHADMAFLANCTHAAHLEVLDLSGHCLVDLFPSTFFRLLGQAAPTLRALTLEECGLADRHSVEFPVPRDCYPEGSAYPQDELAMSKFDQQKYSAIAEDLRAVLLRAGRDDIRVSTPLFGSFDPDIEETSNELGKLLLQAFKTALENFSRALKQME